MKRPERQAMDTRTGSFCFLRLLPARLFRFCLLLWLFGVSPAFPAPLDIVVILSGDSEPYVEIASAIESGLKRDGIGRLRVIGPDSLAHLERFPPDAVVAVGLKATQAVAVSELSIPIISTLIPKSAFDKIALQHKEKRDPKRFTAVYLDQPLARQLDLVQFALPGKRRVGVLLGPESENLLDNLQAEARKRDMTLHIARVDSESGLFPALQNVLGESDALLSLPDSLVFNSRTIPTVLFASYRTRVPVIGFSPAYVRAGALVAVHSTPAQLARQVTEILQRFAAGAQALPPPRHPEYFSVTGNYHVARSLELKLEKEQRLEALLNARKTKP
jgi:ABC-type uncharacterized transport system substrate-binding protein